MSVAQDLIDDARDYASTQLANAQGQMNAAISTLLTMNPQGAGKLDFKLEDIKVGTPNTSPRFQGTLFVDPKEPGDAPDISDPGDLDTSGEPGDAPAMATFNPPREPSGEVYDPTGNGPIIRPLDAIPSAPDLLAEIASIEVPTITDLVIPPAPTYVAPVFDGVHPDAAPAAPTDLEGTMRAEYQGINPIMRDAIRASLDSYMDETFPEFRSGMAAIESRLATYLAGGTALSPEVENAIFNRALDKSENEGRKLQDEAWGKAARAGFTIPSAILLSQTRQIDQERRNLNSRAAVEIAVKQAELEQNNLQFAVTQSTTLRKVALDASFAYYSGLVQINGQALEYARSIVDAIVKAYDVAAKHAEIQARIYDSDARVYESRIKGAMATIEAYATEVKALESVANIDLARVTLYKSRIEAVQAEAVVYTAQVNAIKAQADIERTKVEIYTAQVSAYVAKVNALTARWQGYSAAVAGQAAKMNASAEEQKAWAAKAQVWESLIRGRTAALNGKISVQELKMKAFHEEVEAYKALVEGRATAASADLGQHKVELDAYVAGENAREAYLRAKISSYEAALRTAMAAADIILANLREANTIEVRKIEGIATVSTAAGGIFAGAAQSALSGMNSLATVTLQETA